MEEAVVYVMGALLTATVGVLVRNLFMNNATKKDLELLKRDIKSIEDHCKTDDEAHKTIHKRISELRDDIKKDYVQEKVFQIQIKSLEDKLNQIINLLKQK